MRCGDVVAGIPAVDQARALLADVGPPHIGTGRYVSYTPEQFGAYAAARARFDLEEALALVRRRGRDDPSAVRELAVVLDRLARTDPGRAASIAGTFNDACSRCLLRATVAAAAAACGRHEFAADLAGQAVHGSADIAETSRRCCSAGIC